MFTFDNTTIILSAVLLVMALLTPLVSPFFRKVRMTEPVLEDETDTEEEKNEAKLPPISIIFAPDDNAEELSKYLPLYLNQQYEAPFQVIVVAPQKDNETEDVLKRFADNEHLYTTFIPQSSRYMSRKKLAITLGVKAARYDWILMADICSYPQTENWLQTIARNCTKDKDLVVGYTRYEDETPAYRRFEQLFHALYIIREYQKDKAYRCCFTALLFRKDIFLKEEGFRGNLKYLRGEYDFMVNKYAKGRNLAFENTPEGTLIEEIPTEKIWKNKHLFYMENRQHMLRTPRHRLLPCLDQVVLHLNYLMEIAAIITGLLLNQLTIVVAAALSLLLTMVLRTVIAKKKLNQFNENIPTWRVVPYEIAIIWHYISYKMMYHKADKNDFISHKI